MNSIGISNDAIRLTFQRAPLLTYFQGYQFNYVVKQFILVEMSVEMLGIIYYIIILSFPIPEVAFRETGSGV